MRPSFKEGMRALGPTQLESGEVARRPRSAKGESRTKDSAHAGGAADFEDESDIQKEAAVHILPDY